MSCCNYASVEGVVPHESSCETVAVQMQHEVLCLSFVHCLPIINAVTRSSWVMGTLITPQEDPVLVRQSWCSSSGLHS